MSFPESRRQFVQIMQRHVPSAAQAYCVQLWEQQPFHFRVSRGRLTKLGDYRYLRSKQHRISVNGTLNVYAFLITYLHEVAHLRAFQQHGFEIPPHGVAWKRCFQQLVQPVLHSAVFPEVVLSPLKQHMQNPKAASGSDPALTLALQRYDRQDGKLVLAEVKTGQGFRFRKMTLIKESVRRTRALCREVNSGRRYLIAETARVSVIKEATGDG